MKKIFFLTIAFFYFGAFVSAQPSIKYFEYIDKARNSFEKKEYKKSATLYANAFKANAGKAYLEDRYNAARSWTLAGNKDSAFVQLFKVVILYDYINYFQISSNVDFSQLHTDKRWMQIIDIVKQNISKTDSNLNKRLIILLDSVYRDHHSYRLSEVRIKNEYGADSKEMKEIRKTIIQKDSVNLAIVTSVIEKYGWLGKNVIGFIGNYTLALIIEHADKNTQEKYIPIIREAFKNKNVEAYDLALLEDKISLRQGKQQLYGSVIVNLKNKNYVAPIEDVGNLDKRRTELGLKSMNSYLMNWGLKWDINKYKKDLLLLEKEKIEY